MKIKGKKIFITGADGFIGSHLVEKAVLEGAKVKAFVFYNSFNSWGWLDSIDKSILNEVEVFSGDIRDPYGVRTAMKNSEVIFHLAALIAIPYSYHSPDSYIDTNIKGTLNVLNASKDLNLEKVLVTSTSDIPKSLSTSLEEKLKLFTCAIEILANEYEFITLKELSKLRILNDTTV